MNNGQNGMENRTDGQLLVKVSSKAFFYDAIMVMMVGFQYRILFCTNWHQLGTAEVCWGCKSKGEFLLLNISTEFISIEHTPPP